MSDDAAPVLMNLSEFLSMIIGAVHAPIEDDPIGRLPETVVIVEGEPDRTPDAM